MAAADPIVVPKHSLPESPVTYFDFQRLFPDENACFRYLERLRWPEGFLCETCSTRGEPFRFAARPKVLKCKSCHQDTSITAGTVMHRSKTNIHIWFWTAYLVATQTSGVSALEIQKKFGIERYETAFQILHKLRSAMVRPGRDKIGSEWPVELDVIYVGGKTKSGVSGKTDQTPVIIAVEICRKEIRKPKSKKIAKRGIAGRVRVQVLEDKSSAPINKFVKDNIAPGAAITSDDGLEFKFLKPLGFNHRPVAMRGDRDKMDKYLPMVSRVTANLKTWIDGTFHGVMAKHLQTYLNEYMFRFNRRFYRGVSFRSLINIAILKVGLTYRQVYDGAKLKDAVK
jgi:hypothetical protein